MFISDFAIKRPIITVVGDGGARGVRPLRAVPAADRRVPRHSAPPVVVTWRSPYPGASPDGVEREIVEPVEDAISGISGVEAAVDRHCDRRLRADHRRVRLREADRSRRRRTCATRSRRSASDLPPEMKEPIITKFDPTPIGRSCRSRCRRRRLTPARAHAHRRSRTSRASCARSRASREVNVVGRGEARARRWSSTPQRSAGRRA